MFFFDFLVQFDTKIVKMRVTIADIILAVFHCVSLVEERTGF